MARNLKDGIRIFKMGFRHAMSPLGLKVPEKLGPYRLGWEAAKSGQSLDDAVDKYVRSRPSGDRLNG